MMRGRGRLARLHRDRHQTDKRGTKNRITNNVTTTSYNRECNQPFPHLMYKINFTTEIALYIP